MRRILGFLFAFVSILALPVQSTLAAPATGHTTDLSIFDQQPVAIVAEVEFGSPSQALLGPGGGPVVDSESIAIASGETVEWELTYTPGAVGGASPHAESVKTAHSNFSVRVFMIYLQMFSWGPRAVDRRPFDRTRRGNGDAEPVRAGPVRCGLAVRPG